MLEFFFNYTFYEIRFTMFFFFLSCRTVVYYYTGTRHIIILSVYNRLKIKENRFEKKKKIYQVLLRYLKRFMVL